MIKGAYIVDNEYPLNRDYQYLRILGYRLLMGGGRMNLTTEEDNKRKKFVAIEGYAPNVNRRRKSLPAFARPESLKR